MSSPSSFSPDRPPGTAPNPPPRVAGTAPAGCRARPRAPAPRGVWRLAALALALAVGLRAAADPVTLNLNNADIHDLVATISTITGKNFIIDPAVRGSNINVVSSVPMEEEEIYEVFLSILAVHGFVAVPGDDVVKIIPSPKGKQVSIPTVEGRVDEDDQLVTRVIQVQNVSAAQIVPILRPLIPPEGHLVAYPPTNVLIISDRASNVERIANIIGRVDLASTEDVEIVALGYASATEVVRLLTALEQGRARTDPQAAATAPRLVADERTNSVLMTGDTATRLRLRTLITHLDTPLETGGNTQVIYLRYANATELLPVLQGVSQNIAQEQGGAAQQPAAAAAGKQALIDIQADEATNSLVVTAPPDIIRSLKTVIAQLDVRRAQVLVEAVIAEISSSRAAQLGVQWFVDGSQDGNIVGFTNFGGGGLSLGAIGAAIEANTIPSVPEGLFVGAGQIESSVRFGALVSALASDSDTNVLSTPSLVTLDNEEAEIVVGQNVPFVTGSFTPDSNVSSSPFQTIQRQDVGLTLKIKPQINEGNAVKLEITQEVSSVIESETVLSQGPTTRKRSIKTSVLVEDGQVLVLGGLVQDDLTESVSKVPGLGDIPVLGNLFRFRRTNKTKQNLMVFLHPVILRGSDHGSLHTNDKYSYIRAQQLAARQKGVALLAEEKTPLLTPVEQVHRRSSLVDLGEPPAGRPAGRPAPPAGTRRRGVVEPEPIDTLGFNEA